VVLIASEVEVATFSVGRERSRLAHWKGLFTGRTIYQKIHANEGRGGKTYPGEQIPKWRGSAWGSAGKILNKWRIEKTDPSRRGKNGLLVDPTIHAYGDDLEKKQAG